MPDKSDNPLNRILRGDKQAGKEEPPPQADEVENDALTIADMNGTHSMRPANKNLTRLHVVTKDGKVRTFQYNFLDVQSTFDGGVFTVIFAGTKHWQLTVKGHGKNFWAMYDYITLHRWPFIREATGSMPEASEGDVVIASIDIKDVTPKDEA